MRSVVETLSGLERRVALAVSVSDVEKEVQAQLKRVARTSKVPGFRPGKAPVAMVERTQGAGIRHDVVNRLVGSEFERVVKSTDLRVVGIPTLESKIDCVANDVLAFTATFEVYPEISVPDLSTLSIKRYVTPVTDIEVEKTLDVLRKKHAVFEARDGRAAQDGDRVTLDFAGTIDGVQFNGGNADAFSFVLGQGRMLAEFEAAAKGMKAGETKVFPLKFPDNYQGKEVVGKTAEFTIKVTEVAEGVLPALDGEFAHALGQAEADIEKLKSDIRINIEREVKARLLGRTKGSVIDALVEAAKFEAPKALINKEVENWIADTRKEMKRRGMPNVESMPIPADVFSVEAERRVRLRLLVSELVKQAQLQAKREQVRARIEEFAQNYQEPSKVVSYYLADPQRRVEIESITLEDNVVNHVLAVAKVTEESVPFEQLMEMV